MCTRKRYLSIMIAVVMAALLLAILPGQSIAPFNSVTEYTL